MINVIILKKRIAGAFTQALSGLIKDIAKKNYKSFILIDPYLGYQDATEDELNSIYQNIQEVIKSTKENIGYQIAYSCPTETIKTLLKTDLETIGIDFFNTDIETMPSFENKKTLLAGCLDSRSSLVEDSETLSKFIRSAQQKIKPNQIIATSNIDLQFVPVSIAEKKLISLRKALI